MIYIYILSLFFSLSLLLSANRPRLIRIQFCVCSFFSASDWQCACVCLSCKICQMRQCFVYHHVVSVFGRTFSAWLSPSAGISGLFLSLAGLSAPFSERAWVQRACPTRKRTPVCDFGRGRCSNARTKKSRRRAKEGEGRRGGSFRSARFGVSRFLIIVAVFFFLGYSKKRDRRECATRAGRDRRFMPRVRTSSFAVDLTTRKRN